MVMIRLSVAQLCPDCDVVYDEIACPTCGSENGMWIAKILDKVQMASGCWEWAGTRNALGYARFTRGNRRVVAHRLTYRIFVGRVPSGMELDHTCRNRGCVNPYHLEPVTHTENVRRGDRASLTADQVREIRAATGTSKDRLAAQYGVTRENIHHILTGKTWRNL